MTVTFYDANRYDFNNNSNDDEYYYNGNYSMYCKRGVSYTWPGTGNSVPYARHGIGGGHCPLY